MKYRNGLTRRAWAAVLALECVATVCCTSCDGGKDELLHERVLRQAAEVAKATADAALAQAEAAVSHWQITAVVAIIAAILMLIFGTILGSRARRDAKAAKQEPTDGNVD